MSKGLIQRHRTWYVRVNVPRHYWKTIDKREIVRTTGETDLKLAERRKHRIIAEVQDELAVMIDNVELSPAAAEWVTAQAKAIRLSVQRGELDPGFAGELMSIVQDKHEEALKGSKPDAHKMRRASKLATVADFSPLWEIVKGYRSFCVILPT